MRFTCNRSLIADVAALVGQAVAGKSTRKIFECILIQADKDGSVLFTGTDLEVAVRYRLAEGVEVAEPGDAVVPAQLFAGVLREIADESVTVAVEKQKMTLDTDGGFFELECEDPAQYPEIPEFPSDSTCLIGAEDLRSLVRKTVFAAGREAARYVLNGVNLMVDGGNLRFVATDGRRLATLARPIEPTEAASPGSGHAIVGVKGLQHFERVAAGVEGSVSLAIAKRFVALRTEKAEVTVRVMDGTFPEYQQIVPDETPSEAVASVTLFASKLRQASRFASLESQAVRVTFKRGELEIAAAGGDGRASVRMEVDFDGAEEMIGFNPQFLLDALKVVDGESVRIGFSTRNAAAKLGDDSGFLYVVMPVMID
jgi:DNA polymerase-3 subunit beta